MTISVTDAATWLVEVVIIKYIVVHGVADIIRRIAVLVYRRFFLKHIIRTRADLALYIHWRNQTLKKRQSSDIDMRRVYFALLVALCSTILALGYFIWR